MKKIISILVALISIICMACAFIGCEDKKLSEEYRQLLEDNKQLSEEYKQLLEENKQLIEEGEQLTEENKQLSEENKQLSEENENLNKENGYLIENDRKPAIDKVEVIESGKLYTLKTMYDNGLLKSEDLKSIACNYYDFYKYEDNPYSGMFDPHEELSKETENKIKQAYLEQIVEISDLPIIGVQITNYYGTYNGNVAVGIYSDYIKNDPAYFPRKTDIGGVVFKNFWSMDILVYHI